MPRTEALCILIGLVFLATGCAPGPAEDVSSELRWVDARGVVYDGIVGDPPSGYVDPVYGAYWRLVPFAGGYLVEPAGTLSHEVGVGLLYASPDCTGEPHLDVTRTGYSFRYEPPDGGASEVRVIPEDARPALMPAYTWNLERYRCDLDGERTALPLGSTVRAEVPVLHVAMPLRRERP